LWTFSGGTFRPDRLRKDWAHPVDPEPPRRDRGLEDSQQEPDETRDRAGGCKWAKINCAVWADWPIFCPFGQLLTLGNVHNFTSSSKF
jgi:hypothetical protein